MNKKPNLMMLLKRRKKKKERLVHHPLSKKSPIIIWKKIKTYSLKNKKIKKQLEKQNIFITDFGKKVLNMEKELKKFNTYINKKRINLKFKLLAIL